ncbi:hypothetical protein QJS04_geneDACA017929 [Acorus gramineus]|uniref:Uncharacterized protein n=1 Tax=Acorus gramineus TaxID=55184 RepID=A0AAV9BWF4_ACOGR|nr:hypothetical protein QJS04_geneDACA017929 [Acorus gramineus]
MYQIHGLGLMEEYVFDSRGLCLRFMGEYVIMGMSRIHWYVLDSWEVYLRWIHGYVSDLLTGKS